jgi:hypothetical protein
MGKTNHAILGRPMLVFAALKAGGFQRSAG